MQILIQLERNTKVLGATATGTGIYGTMHIDLRSKTRVRAVDRWLRDRCGGMSQPDIATGVMTRPDSHILEDAVMLRVYLASMLDSVVHEAMRDWNNDRRK